MLGVCLAKNLIKIARMASWDDHQQQTFKTSLIELPAHLEAHPATALRILAEMSRRLRKASSIIGNLSLLDVFGRVARTIVDLAEQEGVSTDEGIFVAKRPTQQELASMVGTTRETVSRVLSRGTCYMGAMQAASTQSLQERIAAARQRVFERVIGAQLACRLRTIPRCDRHST